MHLSTSLLQRRPNLSLLFLGASAALGLSPVNAWWVLLIVIPLMLDIFLAPQQSNWRASFAGGWAFGFGYFIAALNWIAFAFLVDAAHDFWMMPIAVGGSAAFLALFWAIAGVLGQQLAKRWLVGWISFPVAFAALEWVRGHVLTGFPWAVFGQAADGMGPVEQLASVIGMNGLTLMVWLWGGCIYALWKCDARNRMAAGVILASLPLAWAWGAWRLAANPTRYAPDIVLRLVQPNINQNDKWRQGNARVIYDQLLALTAAPSSIGKPVTHILWPESSVPFLLDESAAGKNELANALQSGQTVIVGAVRRSGPSDDANYFTSILVLNDKASTLSQYDKWRLVPGGEFLPFANLLEPLGLRRLVGLPESFTPGIGPTNLAIPGAGFAGMSVCYEAIFPGAVANLGTRPAWLINVTNDGWFGNSVEPYQHLAQMRLRTIELGLPAVRVANTGISAVIDPMGRMTFTSKVGEAGAFDLALPIALDATTYAGFSDFALLGLMLIAIFLGNRLRRA